MLYFPVFFTNPGIEELKTLELPQLIDLLAVHTSEYVLKKDGFPAEIDALKEYIQNIQAAIEAKRTLGAGAPLQTQQPPQPPAGDINPV